MGGVRHLADRQDFGPPNAPHRHGPRNSTRTPPGPSSSVRATGRARACIRSPHRTLRRHDIRTSRTSDWPPAPLGFSDRTAPSVAPPEHMGPERLFAQVQSDVLHTQGQLGAFPVGHGTHGRQRPRNSRAAIDRSGRRRWNPVWVSVTQSSTVSMRRPPASAAHPRVRWASMIVFVSTSTEAVCGRWLRSKVHHVLDAMDREQLLQALDRQPHQRGRAPDRHVASVHRRREHVRQRLGEQRRRLFRVHRPSIVA